LNRKAIREKERELKSKRNTHFGRGSKAIHLSKYIYIYRERERERERRGSKSPLKERMEER